MEKSIFENGNFSRKKSNLSFFQKIQQRFGISLLNRPPVGLVRKFQNAVVTRKFSPLFFQNQNFGKGFRKFRKTIFGRGLFYVKVPVRNTLKMTSNIYFAPGIRVRHIRLKNPDRNFRKIQVFDTLLKKWTFKHTLKLNTVG